MKSNRIYIILIAALFGLIFGFFIGQLLDDFRAVVPEADVAGRFQACFYCPEALFPFLGWVLNANAVTLVGMLAGTGSAALVGWALAGTLFKDEGSSGAGRQGGDETLISTRAAIATQTIGGRATPVTDETLARRIEQLSTLTAASLYETFDAERILTRTHDEAVRLTRADLASLIQLSWDQPQQGKAIRVGTPIDFPQFAPIEDEVLATHQSRIVEDFQAEQWAPVVAGVRSALFVPITSDEKVIGLIGLHSNKPNAFDFEIQRVVETLAAQTAVALSNARRYEDQIKRSDVLRTRAEHLQHLLQVSRSLQPERPLATNLETIAFGLQQNAGFNIAVIGVINSKTNQLDRLAAAGLPAATFDQIKQTVFSWDYYQAYLRPEYQTGVAYYLPRDQAVELYRPFDVFEMSKPSEVTGPDQWKQGDVLLVPVYGSAGEAIGLIQLDDPRDGRTPNHITLESLEMFANPAALVIENARLLAQTRERLGETQERANQLEALSEVTHQIAGALHRDEVVAAALEQLKRVVVHDRVTLYLKDQANGQFRVAALRGLEGEANRLGMAAELLDRSLFAELVANRRALVVGDVSQDARFPKSAARKGSWLGVPLINRGEVLGVLGLDKLENGFYTNAHTPIALAYGNQVAVALENARLYEETIERTADLSERTQRLALLQHASAEVVGALDADRALNVMTKEIAQALGADYAVALVWGEGDEATITRSTIEKTERVSLESLEAETLVRRIRDTLLTTPLDGETLARSGRLWAGETIRSAVALPMAVRETLVGVVVIGSREARREFGIEAIEVGQVIARQAAVMVHNAQQYYQGQQRLIELGGVAQFNKALVGLTEAQPLYEIIRAHVVALTGAPVLALGLHDESRNELVFPLVVRGGQPVQQDPKVPGAVSRFIIQSRLSVLLTGDSDSGLRVLGVAPGSAWDVVEGKSYLAVPLVTGEKLVGILQVAYADQVNAFTTTHERILLEVAPQIAAAIENVRRQEQIRQTSSAAHQRLTQLQERATQLEALMQTAQSLTAALRPTEIYNQLPQQLQKVVAFDRLTIWMRETAVAPLIIVASAGGEGTNVVNSPLWTRLLETQTPLVIPNVGAESSLGSPGNGAWLGVAVVAKGNLLGVIGLDKTDTDYYTARQVAAVESFAAQTALAVENARLFERSLNRVQELDSQAHDLMALNQVTVALSATLDLQTLAQTGAKELATILKSQFAGVALLNGDSVMAARYPEEGDAIRLAATDTLFEQLRGTLTAVQLSGIAVRQVSWVAENLQFAWALPLVAGDEWVGVAVIGERAATRLYADETVRLATGLAGLLATAAQRAGLYQRTQRRLIELSSISQVGRAVGGSLERGKLYDTIHDRVQALTGAETMCVAVYAEGLAEAAYPLVVQKGKKVEVDDRAPVGVIWRVLRTRQPLRATGGADDKQLGDETAAALADKGNLIKGKSVLAVPLLANERLLGVLAVADDKREAFTSEHERLLVSVAAHVAAAIENSRLFETSVKRAQELDERANSLNAEVRRLIGAGHVLEVVNRVSAELSSALNSERILSIAARSLAQALKVESVYVGVVDDGPKLALRWPRTDAPMLIPVAGDGLVEELRETLTPITLASGTHQADWLGGDFKSALVVPLAASGKLVGLAALGSADQRHYETEEIELAVVLANHAALALNNARLHEKTLKRLVDLGSITQTGRAVSGAVELKHLYETVQAQVGSLMGARTMALALYDESKNEVTFPVLLKSGQTAESGPRRPGAVLWHIIQTQQPLCFTQAAETQAQAMGFSLSENGASNGVYGKSYLGVPLVAGNKTIGVLAVADPDRDNAFDAEHERMLTTLAGQVAAAIDHARIYETAARRVQELEDRLQRQIILNRNWSELSQATEVKRMLDLVVGAASQALRADHVTAIWLSDSPVSAHQPAAQGQLQIPAATDPVLQWLQNNATPLVIADLAADDLTRATQVDWLGQDLKSALMVPLTVNGKLLGILGLGSQTARRFDSQEVELVSALGAQVAVAAHNADDHEKTQRKLQEVAGAGALIRALNRVTDLQQLWTTLHTQLTALTGAETLALQLYDETTSEVAIPLLVQHGEVTNVEPRAPGALTRHVLLTQRALLLKGDWKKTALGLGIVVSGSGIGEPLTGQAYLGVPLRAGDRAMGVLTLAADRADTFNESHLAILESVSTPIALAVENARLFARTRGELAREHDRVEHVRQTSHDLATQLRAATGELAELRDRQADYQSELSRLEFLMTLTRELVKPADTESALARALDLTGAALGAEYGVVYVYDAKTGQLVRRATHDLAAITLVVPETLPVSETLIGAAYQSPDSINLTDLASDARWQSKPLFESTLYQSALAAPLVAGGVAVGAVAFFRNSSVAFTADDRGVLESATRPMALVTQHFTALAQQQQLEVLQQSITTQQQTLAEEQHSLLRERQQLLDERQELNSRQQELAALELELAERHTRLDQELAIRASGTYPAMPVRGELLDTTHGPVVSHNQTTEAGPGLATHGIESSLDTETTLVTPRRRVPEAFAEFDVTADDLRQVPDDEESESLAQAGIPPIAWIGGLGVLLVAGVLIGVVVFGNNLFGNAQPTSVSVVVTNTAPPPTLETSPTVALQATTASTNTIAPTATTAPTATPVPTETPTQIPTTTFTPGPTLPPGVVALGTIQVTPGTSARLRASPNGDVVGSVPDNEPVQILQGREVNGGVNWIQIRLNSGQVGWIAENLVETTPSP